jgi:hypothetical protein
MKTVQIAYCVNDPGCTKTYFGRLCRHPLLKVRVDNEWDVMEYGRVFRREPRLGLELLLGGDGPMLVDLMVPFSPGLHQLTRLCVVPVLPIRHIG